MSKAYSNSDYKKLGDRIRADINNISDADYEMLQYLRTSYKSPLSTIFNSIEQLAHKIDANCVCTYRIKRIESIISKLIRFPEMQVNRAEDIAGCRCILSNEQQVYDLYNRILKRISKLPFELKGKINDYIANPKESGYKSIHLNVVVKGDNRRVEIQLRSLEHHNWATLVEISDLLYGLKLKENGRSCNEELFDLHLLLSKAIQTLGPNEINIIADTIIKYGYIHKLGEVFAQNYIEVRKHWNSLRLQSKHFFLIATGSDGIPEIQGFTNFDEAENQYFEMFVSNKSNKNIVLTHLQNTNFTKISIAYSNYFLTFNNTIIRILYHLSQAVEESFRRNQIKRFGRYYDAFLDMMLFWMEKQIIEINSFKCDNNIFRSKKKHNEWASTITAGIQIFNGIFRHTHSQMHFKIRNAFTYYIMRSKYKKFQTKANRMSNRQS